MHVVFVDRVGAKSIWELMGYIATAVLAEGGRATFVMFDDGRNTYAHEVPEGVEVHTIRVPPKRRLWDLVPQHVIFARKFRTLLKRLKPDVVHTNFAVPSIVARWAAAREGVPCIVSTQHELYGSMHPHYRLGLKFSERYCSAIVYVSRTVASSFGHEAKMVEDADFGHAPAHVVIPNGINLDKIRTAIADVRERIPGKIVCAGRMVPVKGQDVLVRALPPVVHAHPHVRLKLIGSGPMETELRSLVTSLGLDNHVEFAGWMPHDVVLREMASASLVVVPSNGEGYGLVLAEALACGAPLLVSDIPVFREVLEGNTGQVKFFPPSDRSALGKELSTILANPLATVANELTLTRFSSHNMTEAYLDVYHALPC